MKKKIKLCIQPSHGRWMIMAQLPGIFQRRAFIGKDGELTCRRAEIREYEGPRKAYRAMERLSQELERMYPGVPQQWRVSRCAGEILRRTDDRVPG